MPTPAMNAVDFFPYPSVAATFSMTASPTAADRLKSDFQNAIRRNLHNWAQWRIQINDSLVDAVMKGSQMAEVEPIGDCLDRAAPHPGHPTSNPKTLLTFSATANSSTPLPTDEFYKYGIPRARIDPQLQYNQRHLPDNDATVGRETYSLSAPALGQRQRSPGRMTTTLVHWRVGRMNTVEMYVYRPAMQDSLTFIGILGEMSKLKGATACNTV